MKTLKTIAALAFLSLTMVCGVTAQTNNTLKNNGVQKPASVNTTKHTAEIKTTSGTNSNVATTNQPNDPITQAIQPNNNTANVQLERRTNMYKTVVMDKDQVKRYETDYETNMAVWRKSNPNREMSNTELSEYNNRTLKPILNDKQYTAYQQWETGYPHN